MNTSGWSLREEVEYWISRWYVGVLVFLVGGASGWGISYIIPADYEARAPLLISFNADAIFTSPDDYKNAQFEEVTDLMLSDRWLDEVLKGLHEDWSRQDLRDRFSVRWRNAGRWDLVVRDRDADQSARLAAVWREVAFDQVMDALYHAQMFYELDLEFNIAMRIQGEVFREQTQLQAVKMSLHDWLAQSENERMSATAREELLALTLMTSPAIDFPGEDADPQVYVNWAENLILTLETKQQILDAQDQAIREEISALSMEWLIEKTASRGLSAFLVVEMGEEVESNLIREPGILTLIGGVIGVSGWLGFRFVNVARNFIPSPKNENDQENG